MSDYCVIGLDLSLSSTGCFIINKNGRSGFEIKTKPDKFSSIFERVDYITSKIMKLIEEENPDLIIMEDYFVGGRNPQTSLMLSVLGTIMRWKILDSGREFLTAAPNHIKKFETGNGNAQKDVIIKSVFKKHNYDTNSNNVADACSISYLGYSYLEYKNGKKDFMKYELEVLKQLTDSSMLIKPFKGVEKYED